MRRSEAEMLEVVSKFGAGVADRDESLLASILAADVVWTVPGKSLISGEAHGIDGVLARVDAFHRFGVQSELEQVVYGFDDVAVRLHNVGAHEGRRLDEYLAVVFRFGDEGKIRRIESFISHVEMLDAFFVE